MYWWMAFRALKNTYGPKWCADLQNYNCKLQGKQAVNDKENNGDNEISMWSYHCCDWVKTWCSVNNICGHYDGNIWYICQCCVYWKILWPFLTGISPLDWWMTVQEGYKCMYPCAGGKFVRAFALYLSWHGNPDMSRWYGLYNDLKYCIWYWITSEFCFVVFVVLFCFFTSFSNWWNVPCYPLWDKYYGWN